MDKFPLGCVCICIWSLSDETNKQRNFYTAFLHPHFLSSKREAKTKYKPARNIDRDRKWKWRNGHMGQVSFPYIFIVESLRFVICRGRRLPRHLWETGLASRNSRNCPLQVTESKRVWNCSGFRRRREEKREGTTNLTGSAIGGNGIFLRFGC